MTRKCDVRFFDVKTKCDGTVEEARMFMIANIYIGQLYTVYILSSTHSIKDIIHPST